ncbi:TPA: RNA-binding protein [Candidatus Woesearchaeota archaeon]|nr:RNA-binding protein [Candidatus Woesearchaeota archaeon]HIH12273.1 RNA-binding protein [Candidatus Woesearchaeota archaeon]
MEGKICVSCKKKIANDSGSVTLPCPKCAGYQLVRCSNCRRNGIRYTCPGCNFIGPN